MSLSFMLAEASHESFARARPPDVNRMRMRVARTDSFCTDSRLRQVSRSAGEGPEQGHLDRFHLTASRVCGLVRVRPVWLGCRRPSGWYARSLQAAEFPTGDSRG